MRSHTKLELFEHFFPNMWICHSLWHFKFETVFRNSNLHFLLGAT